MDVLISEFSDFISVSNKQSNMFDFYPRSALVIDIEEKFKDSLRGRERLDVIFITETGKKTEKILGMITAWDMAGYKDAIDDI